LHVCGEAVGGDEPTAANRHANDPLLVDQLVELGSAYIAENVTGFVVRH